MNLRILTAVLWMSGAAAATCQCPALTTEEQQEQATYIFTARVMDTGVNRETGKKEIMFDVLDIYKGNPGSELTAADALAKGPCELSVREEEGYLVYARWEWGAVVTSRCAGTKKLEKAIADAHALGPSDAIKETFYDKLQATCMGKKTTRCCLDSLRAMRSGRYLLEPEGGCFVGTVPDRLRCAGSLRWCVPATETPAPRGLK
jgi:hypothetical protein